MTRGLVATESQEQAAFVGWFRLAFPGVLIFAVPNGAHLAGSKAQKARQMARLKAEGLVEGIPDLCIPAWDLFVEFKRADGGRVSPAQKEIHRHLTAIGQRVLVANGWDEARRTIEGWSK